MDYLTLVYEILIVQVGRYFIIGGFIYWLFWRALKVWTTQRRIQNKDFQRTDIRREVLYSLQASVLYAVIGAIPFAFEDIWPHKIYMSAIQFGWFWLIASYFVLIAIHDTYFYWMHRFMHHRKVFSHMHHIHHKSTNPSPFATFAFHPLESILEFIWFIPIQYFIPLSFHVIILFSMTAFMVNVMGHVGADVYPAWWRKNRWLRYVNDPRAHNDHHRLFRGNYGLYTLLWDRWAGTLILPAQQDGL